MKANTKVELSKGNVTYEVSAGFFAAQANHGNHEGHNRVWSFLEFFETKTEAEAFLNKKRGDNQKSYKDNNDRDCGVFSSEEIQGLFNKCNVIINDSFEKFIEIDEEI